MTNKTYIIQFTTKKSSKKSSKIWVQIEFVFVTNHNYTYLLLLNLSWASYLNGGSNYNHDENQYYLHIVENFNWIRMLTHNYLYSLIAYEQFEKYFLKTFVRINSYFVGVCGRKKYGNNAWNGKFFVEMFYFNIFKKEKLFWIFCFHHIPRNIRREEGLMNHNKIVICWLRLYQQQKNTWASELTIMSLRKYSEISKRD